MNVVLRFLGYAGERGGRYRSGIGIGHCGDVNLYI